MPKNKYNAPKSKWKKWSKKGQELFNFIYRNAGHKSVTATHVLGKTKQTKKVINAIRWNIAWLVADEFGKKAKSKK